MDQKKGYPVYGSERKGLHLMDQKKGILLMDQKKRRPVDGSEKNGLCWWIKNGLLLINWKRKFSCWWLRRKRPTVDRSEKGLLLMGQKKKNLYLWIRIKKSSVDESERKGLVLMDQTKSPRPPVEESGKKVSCRSIRKKWSPVDGSKKGIPCWWIKNVRNITKPKNLCTFANLLFNKKN